MGYWKGSLELLEVIVYRSLSNDVYLNLALEDWIYQNIDLQCKRILLLWRNDPCVVIGRHQNPWMECNVNKLKEQRIKLARRRSGGGTVYHDLGNLNCTFFTNRQDYKRLRNLQLVCDAVNSTWKFGLTPTQRGDILTSEGKKVTGSAAKLSKDKSYHHFTLLINVNKENLKTLLKYNSNLSFTHSGSTPSVPSPTANLCDLLTTGGNFPSYNSVCNSIATLFYKNHHLDQSKIYDIDPGSESTFPNIPQLKEELIHDNWIYNKTPTFTVTHKKIGTSFTVSKGIITQTSNVTFSHLLGQSYLDYTAHLE